MHAFSSSIPRHGLAPDARHRSRPPALKIHVHNPNALQPTLLHPPAPPLRRFDQSCPKAVAQYIARASTSRMQTVSCWTQ
eukprot:357743-Chlamydomonas_euryale.AAC.1